MKLEVKNLVKKSKIFSGDLKNKVILDIGCNDGSLLDIFKKEEKVQVFPGSFSTFQLLKLSQLCYHFL